MVIVKGEGAVLGREFAASYCNQRGLCKALSNYFEDLLSDSIPLFDMICTCTLMFIKRVSVVSDLLSSSSLIVVFL